MLGVAFRLVPHEPRTRAPPAWRLWRANTRRHRRRSTNGMHRAARRRPSLATVRTSCRDFTTASHASAHSLAPAARGPRLHSPRGAATSHRTTPGSPNRRLTPLPPRRPPAHPRRHHRVLQPRPGDPAEPPGKSRSPGVPGNPLSCALCAGARHPAAPHDSRMSPLDGPRAVGSFWRLSSTDGDEPCCESLRTTRRRRCRSATWDRRER